MINSSLSLARRHSRRVALLAAAASVAALAPGDGRADWIPSALDARCEQADIDGISQSIRDAIEASVRRAEASIAAPAAIGDLGCLNDLMNAPLDIFSNVGGLMGTLQGGLFDSLPFSMDMDVSGMVCDFAAEKWGELTGGLGDMDIGIDQFANTPASMVDRLAGGGGFGSGAGGSGGSGTLSTGMTGTSSLSGANAGTGTGTVTIPIGDEAASNPIFPDPVPDPGPSFVFDQAGYSAAMSAYEASASTAMMSYMACEIARRLATVSYDEWGNPRHHDPTYCPSPNLPSEPNIEDYFLPASASGGATFTPLSAPAVVEQPRRTVAPSDLVGSPEAPATRAPSRSGGSRGDAIQSIWEKL